MARTTSSEIVETLKQDVFVIGDRAYNADDNGVVADRKGEPAYRNRIVYDKGDNYYYNDKR